MLFFVRLGTRSPNEFIQHLNQKNESIQKLFLSKITNLTKMIEVKVMMGDSTITEQKTFDPKQVTDYFQTINNSLKDWSIQDVSISNNEDVRRVFSLTDSEIFLGSNNPSRFLFLTNSKSIGINKAGNAGIYAIKILANEFPELKKETKTAQI